MDPTAPQAQQTLRVVAADPGLFDTVLVANRGEIAVRVIRTLHAMGIRAVAVYSDADADALHVHLADTAVRLGPAAAAQSYLRPEKVVAAALATGAQAVHPGYGFLSENVELATALAAAGIAFIGPPVAAIRSMGDKIRAKDLAITAGAPVVPGVHRPGMDDAALIAAAPEVGYPLMVKASAGGGGKGMRVVEGPEALADAITAARREAMGGFGDDTLMLERYVQRPRHIEIQVLADAHGTTLWVGERECSLQRRHQKVIEECPSPVLTDDVRQRMGAAAVAIAEQVGYEGAGTVEFITDADAQDFYFLEMNTRLQVEHPVTEAVYGLDLVEAQVRIAAGQPLGLTQAELVPDGHAIEARVYAEDPDRGFLPTGGPVVRFDTPAGVRVDTGVTAGSVVTADYDPMVAKVIAHGADRAQALARLDRGLAGTILFGFASNVAFLRRLLADPAVRGGALHTGLIGELDLTPVPVPAEVLAAVALLPLARAARVQPATPFDHVGGWRLGEPAWTRSLLRVGAEEPVTVAVRLGSGGPEVAVGDQPAMAATVQLDGSTLVLHLTDSAEAKPTVRHRLTIEVEGGRTWVGHWGRAWAVAAVDPVAAGSAVGVLSGTLTAPMPGSVAAVWAALGDVVSAGQSLVVVEAMKMEHPLTAPFDGVVAAVHVAAGDQVAMEAPLIEVTPTDAEEQRSG